MTVEFLTETHFKAPEQYRLIAGIFASDSNDGNNGAFIIPDEQPLFCIASDGMGWEHVSVSLADQSRLPTHAEMERVKNLFWDNKCYVVEFHPPESEYVSNAKVLHLWRPIGVEMPVPPSILVGIK